MSVRNLIFVYLCLSINNVAKAEETPQDTAIAFYENSTDGEKDKFLLAHTLSGGWMSEGIYEQGLIANAPGEGVGWGEYELVASNGFLFRVFGAISDDDPGWSTSYANEIDLTLGYQKTIEGEKWETTLEFSAFYWNLGTPSLGSSKEDVWGFGFKTSWASDDSHFEPYITGEQFFGIADGGAGNGTVVRAGVEGEWGDEIGWAINLALGHNFGWFDTEMTYLYVYVGPSFLVGEGLYFSAPEVTWVLQLDGNGESLAAASFTFTKTWGD